MKEEKKNVELSAAQKRHRKFLLIFPGIAIPLLCLVFHALGGGKSTEIDLGTLQGFNAGLPEVTDGLAGQLDKMALYERALKDSLEREKQRKIDPYGSERQTAWQSAGEDTGYLSPLDNRHTNPQEDRIYEKLSALQKALDQPEQVSVNPPATRQTAPPPAAAPISGDVERLEQMMRMMQQGNQEADPEMEQINKTLESILDIQHPERVQDRLRRTSEEHKGMVYAVSPHKETAAIGMLDNKKVSDYAAETSESIRVNGRAQRDNQFYGIDNKAEENRAHNGIHAVIHEDQVVVNGSTVKLRLTDDVYINGKPLPAGSFVFGMANLRGERLEIAIDGLQAGGNLLPVKLSVYDMDGISGVRIPGAISRDVAKQSGSSAVSGISPMMMDPSIGAQAMSAGIELSKSLLTKKIKLVRVNLKAGYQILLKDNKQRDY